MAKRKHRPNSNANANAKATSLERAAIDRLRERIKEECPPRGYAPPLNQKVSFRSLPISEATLRGLEGGNDDEGRGRDRRGKRQRGGKPNGGNDGGGGGGGKNDNKKNGSGDNNFSNKKQFWTMTDIQNACIPHALMGRDILGAARTGR